jgi:hypothetical protein
MTLTTTTTNRRRKALAIIAGLGIIGGLTAASAASLGGITANNLGADVTTVASCDTDGVSVSFGTPVYNATSGAYDAGAVTVYSIDALCAGQSLSVTLKGATGALGNATIGLPATGFTGAATLTIAADAKAVTGAAVVIAA